MIILAFIVWLFAHTGHPHMHWAVDVWSWMCHHVILTILILLVGG